MKDNSVNKNNKLAGWIEDFITNFAKVSEEKEVNSRRETVAEININELDTIVWNDETFYVFFDESGASIINAFGNTVTTLDDIFTIEEVNQKLNSKQIVSSIDNDLANEIDAALSTIEANEADDEVAKQYVDEYNDSNSVQDENNEQAVEAEMEKEIIPEEVTEVSTEEPTEELSEELSEDPQISTEHMELESIDINEQLKEMEDRLISEFDSKLQAMMDKMFARINPGNVYDLGEQIENEEVQKFTDEAVETEQQIAEENSIDRTIPEGRYHTDEVEDFEEFMEEGSELLELEEFESEEFESEEFESEDEIEIEDAEFELLGDDAEVFKTATCPCCGDKLYKTASTEETCTVTCDNEECSVKYVIDLNNGKIFIQ